MTRTFLDTTIIFAAALSPHGASREIIRRGLQGTVGLVLSDVVIEEARRNIANRYPELLDVLEMFFTSVPFEIVQATQKEVITAATYVVLKDAPIVAAAQRARVDYLVTMDKQHLVNVQVVQEVKKQLGVHIILPESLLDIL